MPITHRPKIETGSQPTDPFEVIPRIYLSYITSDTSSKASDSTIANTPVARLPKNSSTQRIRHSKPESWSTSVMGMLQQLMNLRSARVHCPCYEPSKCVPLTIP